MDAFIVIIISVFIALSIIGFVLPKKRTAEKATYLYASPPEVFSLVADIENQIKWRKELKDIQIHDSKAETWTEVPYKGKPIFFQTLQKTPNSYWEFKFKGHGFHGYWQGTYKKVDNGITKANHKETIILPNPIIRLLSYIFVDPKKFITLFFEQLANQINANNSYSDSL